MSIEISQNFQTIIHAEIDRLKKGEPNPGLSEKETYVVDIDAIIDQIQLADPEVTIEQLQEFITVQIEETIKEIAILPTHLQEVTFVHQVQYLFTTLGLLVSLSEKIQTDINLDRLNQAFTVFLSIPTVTSCVDIALDHVGAESLYWQRFLSFWK